MLEQSGDTLNKKHQNLVKMEVLKHLNIPLKTAFFHRERGPRLYFIEKYLKTAMLGIQNTKVIKKQSLRLNCTFSRILSSIRGLKMASTEEGNNPRPSCWCHCAAGVRVQGEGGRGGQGGGD